MSKSIDISDLKNAYLWSMPAKLVLCLVVIVAILVLSYFFVFSGLIDEYNNKKEEEANLKTDFVSKAKQAANLPVLKEELKRIEESFAILLKQLPTDEEVPNLIQELNQAGSNNSLQMSATTPENPIADGPVQILPYAISTSGTYEQFAKFGKDVGGLSRIVVLNALKVEGRGGGKLTLNASANTYKAMEQMPEKGSAQ